MTTNLIDVIVRFRVKPGKLELYKQAIDFILPIAEAKEPYVLEYNIYKNAEGVYTQYERYADEAALHRHLEGTMDGQTKWTEAIEIEQVIILGDMSEHFWNLYGSENTHGYSLFRRLSARICPQANAFRSLFSQHNTSATAACTCGARQLICCFHND